MKLLKNLFVLSFLLVINQFSFAQGDDCYSATVLTTSGTYTVDTISTGGNIETTATGAVWYTFTPALSGYLSVNSCADNVDTRVIIRRGDCAMLQFVNFNDNHCNSVAAGIEDQFLNAGTTYFLEWDDFGSAEGFTFEFIYNGLLNHDLQVGTNGLLYSQLPISQVPTTGVPLSIALQNNGLNTLNNISSEANIFNVNDMTTPELSLMNTMLNLPNYLDDTLLYFNGWNPTIAGDYIINYHAYPSENDQDSTNNASSSNLQITDFTYAMDNGNPMGSLSLPDAASTSQANIFCINQNDEITSMSFYLESGNAGDTIYAQIWDFNGILPTTNPIASSDPYILSQNVSGWVNVPFASPVNVNANTCYAVGLTQVGMGSAVQLSYSDELYYNGASWITSTDASLSNWTTWENLPGQNTPGVFMIRANFGQTMVAVTMNVDMNNVSTISPDGVHVAGNFQTWNPGITELLDIDGDGIYTVTILANSFEPLTFLYINGNTFSSAENVPTTCSTTDTLGLEARFFMPELVDVTLDLVCFDECGICPPPDPCENVPGGIICDNFETYTQGGIDPQADFWEVWPGTPVDAQVTSDQALSGVNSLHIPGDNATDLLLLLGDRTTGKYELSWNIFAPFGAEAYYNIQKQEVTGEYAFDCLFRGNGTGGLFEGIDGFNNFYSATSNFNYPTDTWFTVMHHIDLDNDIIELIIDNQIVYSWPFSDQSFISTPGILQLGAVNFRSISSSNNYYVDDVLFVEVTGVGDFNYCTDALDMNNLFGQGLNAPQTSTLINNDNNNVEASSPDFGWECFGDSLLNNTSWLTFTGDGLNYLIQSSECTDSNYLENTQMSIFTGDCNNLAALACNEDGMNFTSTGYELQTGTGTTYFVMVDGNGASGSFCMEVTQLTEPAPIIEVTFIVDMFWETVSPDGVFISGDFTGWEPAPMLNGTGSVYIYVANVPINAVANYKFLNGINGWEDSSELADCGTDDGYGGFNRQYMTSDFNVILDAVCFTSCEACQGVGIEEQILANSLEIAPNPASSYININYEFEKVRELSLKLYNNIGQQVHFASFDQLQSGNYEIHVDMLSSGIYFLVVSDGKHDYLEKVIID